MIGDWANFVLFKVIPTASGEMLVWLSEWQTLVVGVVIIVAGTVWTRAAVRSNQRTAHLISQSLKIMTEAFAESSRNVANQPERLALAATPNGETIERGLEFRLDRLRGAIRGALSVIPQTNDRVDTNIVALLRNISNFSLDGFAVETDPQRRAVSEVERCISGLKSARVESMRCAEAWESLVRLHRAARLLRDATAIQPQERAA